MCGILHYIYAARLLVSGPLVYIYLQSAEIYGTLVRCTPHSMYKGARIKNAPGAKRMRICTFICSVWLRYRADILSFCITN